MPNSNGMLKTSAAAPAEFPAPSLAPNPITPISGSIDRLKPHSPVDERMNATLESNAIPVHIHHLRRKLAEVCATPQIHTVRGIGYFLTERSG